MCWCVWVGNWCVGACGLVTSVLDVCVGNWCVGNWCVVECGLVTDLLVLTRWLLVVWCVWVRNWCVGAFGFVTGVLARVGW